MDEQDDTTRAEPKIVVIDEANGYELCVPENGKRPRDSFWRRKADAGNVAALVTAIKAARPAPEPQPDRIDVARLEPELRAAAEPGPEEPEPEEPKKTCIDCGDELALSSFYPNALAKDGRQSRCKPCDKKRRAEYNQGLHVKMSERRAYDLEVARKRALEAQAAAQAKLAGDEEAPPHSAVVYTYKGVRGGPLIFGYVK
jgi:hypothetical protein